MGTSEECLAWMAAYPGEFATGDYIAKATDVDVSQSLEHTLFVLTAD